MANRRERQLFAVALQAAGGLDDIRPSWCAPFQPLVQVFSVGYRRVGSVSALQPGR